ncbi:MAG: TraR/DksA C4-type zinc finger protein [Candidatus Shapirobacteria bacterium]|nr:TraR/DksA C4-type zinc finger protein [Candidatus Shapirobacteria bacterium]
MTNKKKQKTIKNGFPLKILKPISDFLSREMARLENKKKAIAKEDPFLDTRRISDNASPDTDVVEQIGHERVKALENQVNRKLIQIKKALARIKIGKYGICEKCGKMIDTDRLMVLPETIVCVNCEKKKEH